MSADATPPAVVAPANVGPTDDISLRLNGSVGGTTPLHVGSSRFSDFLGTGYRFEGNAGIRFSQSWSVVFGVAYSHFVANNVEKQLSGVPGALKPQSEDPQIWDVFLAARYWIPATGFRLAFDAVAGVTTTSVLRIRENVPRYLVTPGSTGGLGSTSPWPDGDYSGKTGGLLSAGPAVRLCPWTLGASSNMLLVVRLSPTLRILDEKSNAETVFTLPLVAELSFTEF